MSYADAVAATLRAYVGEHRVNITALAKRSGVSRPTVHRILNGSRPADISQLGAIADALGITVVYLMQEAQKRIGTGATSIVAEAHRRIESMPNRELPESDADTPDTA